MSVILEFTVDNDQFRLGQVLSGPPAMDIELERIVPTGDAVMPFLWVNGDEYESFERKVLAADSVDDLVALDKVDDGILYRITWRGDHNDIIRGITEAEGTVLEAFNSDGSWEFHIRFNDHDRLSQFYNYCTDQNISIHINRTYTLTERTESVKQFGLSNEQREALILALHQGYFDTPSQVSLSELADELSITQQAMSNRIRRGNKQVLTETLLTSATNIE
ncbi:bacterio-opsin activator domain-containing protein [Haloarcula sp. CBA1127]|uniref:bacterio-opsin activator domain-containing protein n=1 Tax=Haloarcula sp. CBA1127 TaxID=1765055 RepID=UPI00073F668B|nr:helix-turn-helix domain-containing protein [Haloarcula sp. CBA1127]